MVARDAELELFAGVLADDARGAVLVYGPPGVGKTRLAEEFLMTAEGRGCRVRRVVAGRTAADLPFGAIAHLLPDEVAPDGDPGRLAEALRRELRQSAGDGRVVLLVDDLPLLDELSLALLTQLAAIGTLLLVGTLRSGDTIPDALATLWSGDRVVRIDLADLDREGTDELLQHVLGGQVGLRALTEFWQASRGNPLYLRELLFGAVQSGWLAETDGVWQLAGPPPNSPRLLELFGARIAGAGTEARAVLESLALCQPLGLDELVAAGPHTAWEALEAMEGLESAGLVEVRTDHRRQIVTLAHPVYAQVIEGSMTRIRVRGTLLAQARRFQEYGLRRREDALRVATWQLGATGTADPHLLLGAARLARHRPDHRRLERLARAALAAGDDLEARLLLAESLQAQCRYREAGEVLRGADSLPASAVSSAALRQRLVSLWAITLAWGLGRAAEAEAVLAEGISTLAPEYRGELVALSAFQNSVADRPRTALSRLAEAPLPAGGRRTRLRTLAEAHALAAAGRGAEADDILEAGRLPWDAEDAESLFVHAGSAHMVEAFAAYTAGRPAAAASAMTTALEHAVEDDLPQSQAAYTCQLGRFLVAAGRPRTAARWARDAGAVARGHGLLGTQLLASACLATALAMCGDGAGASERLAEAAELMAEITGRAAAGGPVPAVRNADDARTAELEDAGSRLDADAGGMTMKSAHAKGRHTSESALPAEARTHHDAESASPADAEGDTPSASPSSTTDTNQSASPTDAPSTAAHPPLISASRPAAPRADRPCPPPAAADLPISLGMVAQARAWTAAADGDLTTARRVLLAGVAQAGAEERRVYQAELAHDVARLGDPAAAAAILEELAAACDSVLVAAFAEHARALMRRDAAALTEAGDRFARLGLTLCAAEAAAEAAALWRDRGEARRAAAATARAHELAAQCEGARTPVLASLDAPPLPLTRRETEICRLAADGVPSRAIADRLFLSVRTVNNHLQNSYTKLGVGSRRELIEALRGV